MSPSNSMSWAEAYLHSKWHLDPSTVWPQYTNVTDRQDNGPIAYDEPLLVMVAQKMKEITLGPQPSWYGGE